MIPESAYTGLPPDASLRHTKCRTTDGVQTCAGFDDTPRPQNAGDDLLRTLSGMFKAMRRERDEQHREDLD